MILGLSTNAFTLLHVTISLLAIGSGIAVLCGLLMNRLYRFWNSLFLVTASLTDITGFAFPNTHITLGIIVGVLSLITLILAAIALPVRFTSGAYRGTFVVSITLALYFNIFVLVAQLFRHVLFLKTLDPSGAGPVFGIAQLLVMVIFTWLGIAAFRRFTSESLTVSRRTSIHRSSMESQGE